MFIVAFYFLCIAFISYGIGAGLSRLFKNEITSTDQFFLGLAGITVFASIWAIWLPLDDQFSIVVVVLALILGGFNTDFKDVIRKVKWFLSDLKKVLLLSFIIVVVALAASMPAYALDNELYYIQTIKWLDQYGFVKGLGNLYILFAQQSGVHILQAALNFDELYDRFNDISAFFLLIGWCWSAFAKAESTSYLATQFKSLFPLALFLFLLFSTAPTSDIPVYVLSYYVIYKFLILWDKSTDSQLLLMSLSCVLIAYFKITAVLIFIFPLVLMIKNATYRFSILYKIIAVGTLFTALFITKNIIISGLPFYPITTWTPVEFSWQVHLEIANHYKELTQAQPFHTWASDLANVNFLGKVNLWLFSKGFESYLNWFTLLSCFASIFFIWKSKKRKLQIIAAVFLLQSSILFLTSPQFRFFLNLLYPVVILMTLYWSKPSHRLKNGFLVLGYTTGLLLFIAPQMIAFLTDNPAMKNNAKLEMAMFLEPSRISKFSKEATRSEEGNFIYHHSKEDSNFWSTNDVPLPAVQKQYIDYYKKYFKSRPQLRTDRLKDGFYSDTSF